MPNSHSGDRIYAGDRFNFLSMIIEFNSNTVNAKIEIGWNLGNLSGADSSQFLSCRQFQL